VAAQLPLDQLVTEATELLDAAEGFLGADGLERVPDELAQSLAEVRALATELREGGAVTNLNNTLASAGEAAAAVTAATAQLPALVDQLNAVAARADAALATVTPGAELNREAQQTLRDVRAAVQAFNALVTALERRPNSVLFGR
jgi:paraquat-inducible protein B